MNAVGERYVSAAGVSIFTGLYNPLMAWTMRERMCEVALLVLATGSSGPILDLGCGTGTQLIQLARRAPTARLIGIDGDADILNRARVKLAAAAGTVELHRALADDLPLPDGSVQVAIATLVLHHLSPDGKRRALTELRRVLRPGGALVIADWGRAHDPLTRAGFLIVQLLDGPANTRDHAAGRLPSFIRDAGFGTVVNAKRWRTAFGSLDLFSAERPGGAPAAAASDQGRDSQSHSASHNRCPRGRPTVPVSFRGRGVGAVTATCLACAELPPAARLERSAPTPPQALRVAGPSGAGATSASR